ncbi:MAG TPA: TonB family protein [Polyangiaceae bacterium]|nr:TonB family protein [Polyangiaceae bacterium]
MSDRSAIYLVSVGAHALLALGLGVLREPKRYETVAIAVIEAPRPPEAAPAPPPPPPEPAPAPEAAPEAPAPPKPAAAKAPAKAAPKAAAEPAPAPVADAPPDFGLSLSGGVGSSGLAVPAGDPQGSPGGRPQGANKLAAAKAPPRPSDGCDEPPGKPKARSVPQPAYSESARAAGIEGKVRVEISVDERGRITGARVLQGLGHGLDEAALDAAKRASFEPATRCGKAVAATFVVGMRFSL